jgi:uncharacterized protein
MDLEGWSMKRIFKMIGLLALYVLAYVLASILIGIALVIILIFKYIAGNHGMLDSNLMMNNLTHDIMQYTTLIVIVTSILTFLLLFVIFAIRKKSILKTLSFRKISLKSTGFLIIAAISLYFLIASLVSYFMDMAPVQKFIPDYEKVVQSLMNGNIIITVLCVGIVAPLFEEIFFRGLIFNELRENIPIVPAVIIQALFFGLFHGNLIQGAYAFVIGIVFALAYIWTKSLWASILLHFLYNNIGLVMDRLTGDNLSDRYLLMILIAGFAVSAAAVFMLWKNRIRDNIKTEPVKPKEASNIELNP